MSGRDGEDGFLRRWSRRKIAGGTDGDALPGASPDASPPENAADAAELEAAAIADLPDIETLDKDSDYTGFLRDGVPEELKRLALRKLWLSDPVFANLDGLNDYDEDFNAILKSGAEFVRRLLDAGEKLTRPGESDDRSEAIGEAREPVARPDSDIPSDDDVTDTAVTPDDTVADSKTADSDCRSRG